MFIVLFIKGFKLIPRMTLSPARNKKRVTLNEIFFNIIAVW